MDGWWLVGNRSCFNDDVHCFSVVNFESPKILSTPPPLSSPECAFVLYKNWAFHGSKNNLRFVVILERRPKREYVVDKLQFAVSRLLLQILIIHHLGRTSTPHLNRNHITVVKCLGLLRSPPRWPHFICVVLRPPHLLSSPPGEWDKWLIHLSVQSLSSSFINIPFDFVSV